MKNGDCKIGSFDTEFVIDFFAKEVGAYFYNRRLYDAQALIAEKIEKVSDSILVLGKSVDFNKKHDGCLLCVAEFG